MIRPSKHFVIFKKDLLNENVLKKDFKGLTEFWIYTPKKTDLILSKSAIQQLNKELASIIICGRGYIMVENAEAFTVEGAKFTNDEKGNDLYNYLRETGRN
jgi:hypothetical protein